MVDIFYLGGLAAVALGFILYCLWQVHKRDHSNTSFRPHMNVAGDFMCVSLKSALAHSHLTGPCRPGHEGGALTAVGAHQCPPGTNDTAMDTAIKTIMIHSSTSIRRVVARFDILL